MASIFSSLLGQSGSLNIPQFETRKALIVINMQNDSFDTTRELVVCEPSEFIQTIKVMVPFFRRTGDIVWVRTEYEEGLKLAPPSAVDDTVQRMQAIDSDSNQKADQTLEDDDNEGDDNSTEPAVFHGQYFASSRTKAKMRRVSARKRNEQRMKENDVFDADGDVEAYLHKPRKGQPPGLYRSGTSGAALTEDMLSVVDAARDLEIVKNHYSALDATPLLLSLRMKLVTHVYLCGLLSNISVYATAADAVRHGFEVTVVEDCMGYRSEAKHIEAMRQMADILGVSGIDSEELIQDSGGREPLDADIGIFSGPGYDGIMGGSAHPQSHSTSGINNKSDSITSALPHSPTQKFKKLSMVSQQEPTEPPDSESTNVQKDTALEKSTLPSDSNTGDFQSPVTITMKTQQPLKKPQKDSHKTVLGPGDSLGEGDSKILDNALSLDLRDHAFELVKKEVDWQIMRHRNGEVPRRVAVQGQICRNGSRPIYRHPADESLPLLPFSTTIEKIRKEVEELLDQSFNHALVQLYRDGQDNISEHSDKSLDIARGSSIINVSLGAQRVMTLRTKKVTPTTLTNDTEPGFSARQSQRIQLPHNSVFVLGPNTNRVWLHGIRPDRRRPAERSVEEKAYGGERISITFRQIATFTDPSTRRIWGQGARSKTRDNAGLISTYNNTEMEAMIIAFGKENHQPDFDSETEYGTGFDVVDLVSTVTQLFLCKDEIANLRVKLSLFENRVPCDFVRPTSPELLPSSSASRPKTIFALSSNENPIFRDTDEASSEIVGDFAILFYLSKFYSPDRTKGVSQNQIHRVASQVFSRVTQANELLYLWQELSGASMTASTRTSHSLRHTSSGRSDAPPDGSQLDDFVAELLVWEEYAEETEFVGGDYFAIVDCAFWPVLHEIVQKWEGWSERRYPDLAAYYERVANMESVQKALEQSSS